MKRDLLFSAIIILFIAALTVTHSPLHIAGVATDQGIYQYVGETILDQGVPYKDAWDHKQPLTYMIHALGLLIANKSLWGIWIVELCLLTITGIFSFLLLKRLCNSLVSLLIVLNSLLTIWVLSGYYNPEQLALPLYMIALLLFVLLMSIETKKGKRNIYAILIGVLVAGGFFLKQSLISVGTAIVIVYVLDILLNKRWSNITALLFIAFGFLMVTGIFVVYLGLNHALNDYWNAAFEFNFMYSQTGLQEKTLSIVDELESISTYPGLFIPFLLWISFFFLSLFLQISRFTRIIHIRNFRFWSFLIGGSVMIIVFGKFMMDNSSAFGLIKILSACIGSILLIAGIVFSPNGKAIKWADRMSTCQLITRLHEYPKEMRALIYLISILFPITLILNSLSGEHYDYYKISLFPSLILAQGVMAFLLLSRAKDESIRNLVVLCLIGFWIGSAISPLVNLISQYKSKPDVSFLNGISYIKQTTSVKDTIYVWGTDTSIYIMSDRKSPTRYFYQLAAVAWEPYEKEFGVVNEILNALKTNKPSLFVLPNTISLGDGKQKCLDVADNLGITTPVFEFVCNNYQYDRSFSDFQVYRLIATN